MDAPLFYVILLESKCHPVQKRTKRSLE